ncbi:proline dehydrogenase 2, mitochondrial isoform X2 [Physcomitrium patens]|uniref:proline dehydrogenase 2, mitochondrial isoform X2 n=1 Tax=Physcomitrium patens TaxID=3218 RepID=UPI000D164DFF|nr:proline dehydrogenase 2, mitochondrial-like [Physcomitrium patens]|eukprot:XP_024375161.1 proline dehydrogenase 2, mitochondrial-like [Physcomitrella patens]
MAWRSGRPLFKQSTSSGSLGRTLYFSRWRTTKARPFPLDLQQSKDEEGLFGEFKTLEFLKIYGNVQLIGMGPVVDLGVKVLTSPWMEVYPVRAVALWGVKHTVYSHFCAGQNIEEASETLQRMWELGLRGILDYGLEDAIDNASCDRNLEKFLQVVRQTSLLPQGSVSSSCVKLSAVCPIELLERVSNLLRWQHVNRGFKLPWKQDVIPFLSENSLVYHVTSPPEPLTKEEEANLVSAHERLTRLCKACEQEGLPLLIDAEYSSVQPAIDYIIHAAAAEFNKGAQLLVYGTVQAYLKDSFSRLKLAARGSQYRGLSYGVKLVRGAYMSRESRLASSLGALAPTHSNIEETHRCYDACAAFMLEQAAHGDGAVVLATHNVKCSQEAAAKVQELGFSKENPRVQFAQLKGMADVLSLRLAQEGFRVSKYLAFGPVEDVIPYLVRRTEENRGLLRKTLIERQSISAEISRRVLRPLRLQQ